MVDRFGSGRVPGTHHRVECEIVADDFAEVLYYGGSRTHLALAINASALRAVERLEGGKTLEVTQVGGGYITNTTDAPPLNQPLVRCDCANIFLR